MSAWNAPDRAAEREARTREGAPGGWRTAEGRPALGGSARRGAAWGLLLALTLFPLFGSQAQAQGDHRLRWRTLETAHFRIHYHEPLGVLAREIAAEAEEINTRVGSSLGLTLRQPVELIVSDESDNANGFARVLPYNAIQLRAAAPDDMSPLSDYDHWPRLLLTHEHTHVLHLEESGGIPRFLQQLFGRYYTPQNSLPGWFKEGLAVVQESEHTTGGRVRSTMFDMYMRMDALEERILGLDLIGFEGEPWPHGQVRYSYGQAFVAFLARRHGMTALGAFVEEYGRRVVPYGLNRALKRVTGETFVELYDAFKLELRARAEEAQKGVVTSGRVEGVRLTEHGELTRSPRFVSADELVYLVADARHVPELRLMNLDPRPRARRIVRVGSVGQAAHVPSTRRVVYSQVDYHRGVYAYDELFAVNLDGSHERQLTHALRAREPDVSPDGTRIAYVTQGAGTSHLELAELADIEHTRRVVVRSRRLDQVYTPRWSPDGRRIAYSAFERGGYRDIWVLDVESGERTRITYDRAIDRGPVFSPDGACLYFSSDRTGIANLYRYELATGTLSQLTNVVGGAFQPDVSPDGHKLVYLGYGSRGFDVYLLDLKRVRPRPAAPAYSRSAPRALPKALPQVSEAYQPLRSLWPRYYALSAESAGAGTRLVLTTRGFDPVGLHDWSLRASSTLDMDDRALELGYAYRQARLPLLLYGTLHESQRTDLIVSRRRQPWRARQSSLTVATSVSWPAPLYRLSLRVEYVASFLQKTRSFDVPLDPNYPPPALPPLGYDGRVIWTATYSSTQRQPFDISTSWGRLLTVSTFLADPYLGSRERDHGLSYRAEQFARFAFRESVLAIAYTGAHSWVHRLGGFPAQIVPLGDALLGTRGPPVDYARLRGFPAEQARRGEKMAVVQLEYRLLISRMNRGYETLPVFARRVHAAVFVDAGDAWSGRFAWQRVGVGVGAELRLDWASDYGANYTLRAGLAQGVTAGGELQWYTALATPF